MLEIRERNIKNELGHEIDYVLENGVELYSQDWNGEIYAKGYDRKNHKDTEYYYRPVYKELENEDFEIIGFEEHV